MLTVGGAAGRQVKRVRHAAPPPNAALLEAAPRLSALRLAACGLSAESAAELRVQLRAAAGRGPMWTGQRQSGRPFMNGPARRLRRSCRQGGDDAGHLLRASVLGRERPAAGAGTLLCCTRPRGPLTRTVACPRIHLSNTPRYPSHTRRECVCNPCRLSHESGMATPLPGMCGSKESGGAATLHLAGP
jgi:hypothetical protein